jgi:hypothetical protein
MNPPSPTPTNSRFGWPKPKRTEEFKKLMAEPGDATERLEFQGKTQYFRVVRVPIELPKYRLENGRTSSFQSEYLAKNAAARRDLFSGDAELWDAQEVQHQILLELAKQEDLQKYFENVKNQQTHPILLNEYGFVVNGNRRLATWRELFFHAPAKYGHFRHINVAVLPHCEKREIDRLEVNLQIEEDIKADYIWHAHANMMLAQQNADGYSNKELAELHKMKLSEVEELLDMRRYADEYLRSRGKADLWSHVTGHELAFRRIVTSRTKISGIGKQTVFKEAAFTLIDNPNEAGDSLHDAIHNLLLGLDQITEKLSTELKPESTSKAGGLDDFFGGSPSSATDSTSIPLAKAIQQEDNRSTVRKVIAEAIEVQKLLKKESKNAEFLLNCCSKAHALLVAAAKDGLRPESKLAGVQKQLDQIQAQSDKIRKYLKEHAED